MASVKENGNWHLVLVERTKGTVGPPHTQEQLTISVANWGQVDPRAQCYQIVASSRS